MLTEDLLHVIDIIDLLTELAPLIFGVGDEFFLFVKTVTEIFPSSLQLEERRYLGTGRLDDGTGKILFLLLPFLSLRLTLLLRLLSCL